MKALYFTFGAIVSTICLISILPPPAIAGCIQVTCYCRIQVPCGSSNEDCIRACGDEVPLASTPSPGFGTPTYKNPSPDTEEKKKHRELNRQRFEAEMERRRQEGEEERKQEDERRKQFDRDKQKALELLKSGSKSLGLKKDTGTGLKLKGVSAEAPTLKTDKYKEPPYTKGHKAFG